MKMIPTSKITSNLRSNLDTNPYSNTNPKSNPNPNSHYSPNPNSQHNPNPNFTSKMTTATAFSLREKAVGPSYSRFNLAAKPHTNPNPKSNPNPNSHYNPNPNSTSKMTTATAFSLREKAVGPSYSRFNLYRRNLYRRNGNRTREKKKA